MTQADETLYQIKFLVEDVGKKKPGTKKRITWTFALGDQEHTVTFLWSKLSGKQSVLMQGEEVHIGEKNKGQVFFHKWTTKDGNFNLHILACAATPAKGKVASNFRKYELMVNSMPFSSMPTKDGTTPETLALPEDEGKISSIIEIIYPGGYQWDTKTAMGKTFSSRRKLSRGVHRRT